MLSERSIRVLLIGTPNTGKTSLFNLLVKGRGSTGNWAGVTVAEAEGEFRLKGIAVKVVDTPGLYTLALDSTATQEQQASLNALLNEEYDVIINVIDAGYVERDLLLSTQLLDLNKPMIICVNYMEQQDATYIQSCTDAIRKVLKIPAVGISCKARLGIDELMNLLPWVVRPPVQVYPPIIEEVCRELTSHMQGRKNVKCIAVSMIEVGESFVLARECDHNVLSLLEVMSGHIATTYAQTAHHIITQHRLNIIAKITGSMSTNVEVRDQYTWLDSIVFGRVTGPIIFCLVMFAMFSFSINVGGVFQDSFELVSRAIFIDLPAVLLSKANAPGWLIAFIAGGIGGGITTVVSFIPIVGALFIALSVLEESGYFARAAVLADVVFKRFGLPGSAFMPLLVSFGCNVPAVLATRALPGHSARVKTALMAPFMSCSERLTVYVLFCSAFFPKHAGVVIMFLYILGVLVALLTSLLLNFVLPSGQRAALCMELPKYQWPSLRHVYNKTVTRLEGFTLGAGKTIVAIFVVVYILAQVSTATVTSQYIKQDSILVELGKGSIKIFQPMGIGEEQWPLALSLLTGVLAKEVVIGTLSAVYNQGEIFAYPNSASAPAGSILEAWSVLKENISSFSLLGIPTTLQEFEFANTHAESVQEGASLVRKLQQNLPGPVATLAYLIFVLLYFPCVSVYASIKSELGTKWAIASAIWSTTIAYAIAVAFYQIGISFV